jgi:hypothetical protein
MTFAGRGRAQALFGLLCYGGACQIGVAGADDQIITDRPDFVESSHTVGKARFQVETSIARQHNSEGTLRETMLNTPTLLRLGLADTWELRLETDAYTRIRTEETSASPPQTISGFADTALGVKWHMQDGEAARPSTAWLLHMDLPSGSPSVRVPGIRPSLRASLEWELPKASSLGIMPGVIYDSRDDGHRFAAGMFGVSFGHNWTVDLHTFLEVAARQLAKPADGGNQLTYDLGFSYLLKQKLQVDAAMFIGANHHTANLAWTIGLSVKF